MFMHFVPSISLKLKIQVSANVKDALKLIQDNSGAWLVALDEKGRAVGVVTDGDLRRMILNSKSLETKIGDFLGPFYSVSPEVGRDDIQKIARDRAFRLIPVVDNSDQFLGAWVNSPNPLSGSIRDVLVLAGGKGLRLRPFTDGRPKPLLEVNGRALIDYAIDSCISNGFDRIWVSVNYLGDMIREHLELREDKNRFEIIHETKELGTAGPIAMLTGKIDCDLLVINADVLHNVDLRAMAEAHESSNADATVAVQFHQYHIPFGVIEEIGGKILSVVEKPTQTVLVNAGLYLLSPKVQSLVAIDEYLDMPDLLNMAVRLGLGVQPFMAHERILDVGTPERLEVATDFANHLGI